MNKNLIFTALLVSISLLTPRTGSAQAAVFKLKHRSSYSVQDSDRNPFWPVGWVKPVAGPAVVGVPVVEVVALHPEDFELTAILLGTPPIVVINGREYAEGDFLKSKAGARVQLAKVMDGQAILQYLGKNYPIILHRKGEEQGLKKPTPLPKLNRE